MGSASKFPGILPHYPPRACVGSHKFRRDHRGEYTPPAIRAGRIIMALLLLNGEHECHPRFQNWPQLHHEGISGSFPDTAVESHVIGNAGFS
ncbi:hypothetical protein [Corynebacterium stationis]|uniref:Uncharacterized protein n=1 Tax=Corynebacterium stationis TaxID=1705 RepID=A0AB36CLF4_9CORY|nr:hypothetical protein [Corynebacterium stationis]NME89679.1 hypothetical protein [Corynebacterium stationis]